MLAAKGKNFCMGTKKIISVDFDNTLCMREDNAPNLPMLDLVRKYASEGYKCYVVTARDRKHEEASWIRKNQPGRVRVKDFIRQYDLPIKQCHFTAHKPKGPVLKKIGAILHYDDREEQLESAREYGVEARKPL